MSSFNYYERIIARYLFRFPKLKYYAKYFYTRVVYLKFKKPYNYKSDIKVKVINRDQFDSFFGYYDKSPENALGSILVNFSRHPSTEPPSPKAKIILSVISPKNESILEIEVCSYNWQQGCRACWLTDDLFIFNDFDEQRKEYISRVFSVKTRSEIKQFQMPVQDAYQTEFFLSLNYRRLMKLRPDYGYRNLPDLSAQELSDITNDGLWRVDFGSGSCRLIISIEEVCQVKMLSVFKQANHKLNHVMISPNGKRFIFVHRYLVGEQRFDRLLVADVEGNELNLLADHEMVSHCHWVDSQTIVGYLRGPDSTDGYWLIDVTTGVFRKLLDEQVDKYGDGHPTVIGDWIVTDTYPDKSRMQKLIAINLVTEEVKELGEFFHGFEYSGESRCDLHPRFSMDGKRVYFDTVYTGKRQLCYMEFDG